MHIRSRTSPADLQRARVRRAWACLALCTGTAIPLAALALGIRHPRAGKEGAPSPPVALLYQVEPAAPPMEHSITTPPVQMAPPTPVVCLQIPQPTPMVLEPPDTSLLTEGYEEDGPATIPSPTLLAEVPPPPAASSRPDTARTEPGAAATARAVTPPAYKSTPAPPYPPALRAGRIEGSVRVRISVDATGRPSRVDILAGSGHLEFDTCARDWILAHWVFTPALSGGTPIAGTVTTSVHFVLR